MLVEFHKDKFQPLYGWKKKKQGSNIKAIKIWSYPANVVAE